MDDLIETPQAAESGQPARKRLRTSHACDVCRARKIRCDGNNPCASCAAAEQDCTYGSEANSRGKSDLILEGVLRVERFLHEMSATIATSPLSDRRPSVFSPIAPVAGSSQFGESPATTTTEQPHPHPHPHQGPPVPLSTSSSYPPRTPVSEHSHQPPSEYSKPPTTNPGQPNNSLENAVLDSLHNSTTESVLQWPHFDDFPSLRNEYISIFDLEQARPPFKLKQPPSLTRPFISESDSDALLRAFQDNVNFWYPTLSRHQLDKVRLIGKCFNAGVVEEQTADTCLAYLVMALGCASQTVADLVVSGPLGEDEMKRRATRRETGDLYFEHALRCLPVAHMDVGSVATQCLFFTAMYFAFLRRPLQAWEYINAASAKCLLLLSYRPPNETAEDQERIRRIFWSCYILESDYLAELSALPPSGISRIESSIPLPGAYPTHPSSQQEEQSSLYFLACISMRRLLNRVHQLLYARGTGACTTPLTLERFPYVVAELDHQLEEWRNFLPASFQFTVDTKPAATEAGGFLRQRYLTCRSVIYRPYLMWMLAGGSGGGDSAVEGCRLCLEACFLHVLNLRGFAQTVLVDTWICALSMAGAMLVLLAASRVPALRTILTPPNLDLPAAGSHLRSLLTHWQRVAGGPVSPSVEQSVRVICAADEFIRQVVAAGDMLALYGKNG